MPVGFDVTVPEPLPAFATLSWYVLSVDVADTVFAIVIDSVQVPVPLHPPPDQPTKLDPAAGVAVSVTSLPESKVWVQSTPQLMPVPVIVPDPVPLAATVSKCVVSVNVAVTVVAPVTVTTRVLVPLHPPPDHPVNVEPAAGVAV